MPTSKEIRASLGCNFKQKPACYQFVWPHKVYVGSTGNMSLRMTDHVACFARGYKLTTGGSKGQADLYAQDLREAFVKVEYCESKEQALRMEHNYYQLHGSSGVLYNVVPPKHPRILVYNCLNDKTFVADSIREAARMIGADNANVGKAMHNNHTVKQHRFFAI